MMKWLLEKKRTDTLFNVGDYVYLKLQPYKQTFVALRKNFKHSHKLWSLWCDWKNWHHGLWVSVTRQLQNSSSISCFSVEEEARWCNHSNAISIIGGPSWPYSGATLYYPRKMKKNDMNGFAVAQVLVQRTKYSSADATWEDCRKITAHFSWF